MIPLRNSSPATPGFLHRGIIRCLLGLGSLAAFSSLPARAQYADWTATPPKILPNEQPGAGAVWIVGSGRQVPNRNAFAALESDGSITAWGGGSSGAPTDSGYTAICSNGSAFAALKANGSITAWGDPNKGGSGAPTDSGYTDIYSTLASFIAKKADGSITAWGRSDFGVSDAPTDDGYRSIYTNGGSCVALTATGGIKGWGRQDLGNKNVPTDEGYTAISSTQAAFAALKADGSITSWGDPLQGGSGAPEGSNYTGIYANQTAFAALKNDKTIKAWGGWTTGGTTGAPTDAGYIGIYCNVYAFAALKEGGSIYVWGNQFSGGSGAPTDSGYITISSTREAFAALKADGSITAWGNADYGGSGAPTDAGYVAIYSNAFAFAALKNDGSVRAWGYTGFGGSDAPTDNGYTSIYSNERAFAALKADGSITAWGQADYGVSDAPTDTGFSRIQAVFPNPAFVFTPQLTVTLGSITASSAAVGGAVSTMMDKIAGSRGLVYAIASSNADPLIGGASVTQLVETPLGVEPTFNFELSGLSGNTAYTCKAYVTDTEGVTYYSPVATFSTNLPPLIISDGAASTASVSVTENSSAVTTVSATDADAGQAISYSVTGGTDAARFVVDSSSGALTFVAAPDFEAPEDADADNVYQVVVTATDNGNTPKSATQTVDITVTNVADNGELVLERADGTGLASGDVADFGSQTLGQPVDLTFTLRSVGEADLVLPDGMTFGGASASAFSLVGSFPETVATGSSITFTVRFNPSASGSNTADLSFATNDTRAGRSPHVLNLTGSGLTASTSASYANAASQVRGGWINGTDFTIGAVTTNWPSAESPDKVVDNNTGSKFLASRNNNAGLILSPTNATVAFNRLSLYTANDASERDPASYVIYGSSTVLTGAAGTNIPLADLTPLASGTLTLPGDRTTGPTVVQFANTTPYASYIVAFPTVRSTSGNNLTQISEVQLSQGINPSYPVAMADARGGQLSGGTFTFGSIGSSNPGTNWNANESPDQALDGSVSSKYLLFRNTGAGLIASPQAGPARVNRLSFWTANDFAERDPLTYEVYGFATAVTARSGTLDVATGGTLLGSGTLALSATRGAGPETVTFANSTAYASYLVVFPTVKNSPSTTMTQIAEVQFGQDGSPDFSLLKSTVSVAEDSGTYSEAAFATDITPGLGDVGQTVSLAATNDNNALFSVQPVIAADGTLTFTPASNASGTATVTVIATDSTGLTSVPRSFVIEVTSVIDAPILAAPTFSDVSAYSATMHGEVLNAAVADYSGKAIMYAPTAANSTLEYYASGAVTIPLSDSPFSTTRTNLLASGTQYSVRSCAFGPAGMIYSEVSTFTTAQGAPVILDNAAGLSSSLANQGGGFLSPDQAIGYSFTTGSRPVSLSTVTLLLNSSGAAGIRLRLFESSSDSLPTGDPLRVHEEPARAYDSSGVYATIPLSDWQLSANHSYTIMVDVTAQFAVWRKFDSSQAFESSAGWTANAVVFDNDAGLNKYGLSAYPLVIQMTGESSGGAVSPDAPTSLIATAGDGQVSVAFTAGADGGSAITNYEFSTNDGTSWTAFSPAVTTSPAVITGLTNGTAYSIRLRAVNEAGSGAASDAVSITPVDPPIVFRAAAKAAATTSISVSKMTSKAGGVLGTTVTVASVAATSEQGATVALAGSAIQYTPASGFSGVDRFRVTFTSSTGTIVGLIEMTTAATSGGSGSSHLANPARLTPLSGGRMGIRFNGIPGVAYQLQRSSDLTSWTTIATITAGSRGEIAFTDDNPPAPNGFYRLSHP